MKIEIIYRDLFEYCGQLLINELTNEHEYELIDFGDLIRSNISNKTPIGLQMSEYISIGELIPNTITFEVVKEKIYAKKCKNLLIKSYPKNKEQTDLLVNYCSNQNIEIVRAWHMVALNIMVNLEKIPKYSQMAAKYKSHETIKLNSERSNKANRNSILEIGKHCQVVKFESQSHGINYEEDKQRIKETIHNIA